MTSQTVIFHITHINNLDNILKSNGLHCITTIKSQNTIYKNIAHSGIQDVRASTGVPVPPYGGLHDYVPFYFAPRSPMLYTINQGNVAGYSDGQDPIVYLVTTVEKIAKDSLPYCFTDGHGIMFFTSFYKDLKDLSEIDWKIMKEMYWADTLEDNDRKRRRQAEFLVHNFLPITSINWICTMNSTRKLEVEQLLQNYNINIPVHVKRNWYY
ncbi:type II toxin-antitoxin system toxin DNA ADP-ribosyl transferase DarT [Ectobacillus funiculus]|uniref:DUF4433 domain-containing protein n=1 Tax=Ectobacillus funiculus TaxID=137993 RepID=A0ABV5WFL3_9BACI